MKKINLILAALLLFMSCKENNTTKTKKMSNLTSKNYIETIFKSIKHYDYEPMYYLSYEQNSCFSEILVNDIPVYKNFQKESRGQTFEINNFIFKSGIQKVTIRLYPAGKIGLADFSTLVFDTSMKVEITEADNKSRDAKDKKIITYATPLDVKVDADGYEKTRFVASGKNYYEASFTFDATVPYEFNTLDRAEDLSKWDKDILEERVVNFYKKQWDMINEKRVDDYFSYLELKEKESCQSLFYGKAELQETLETYLEPFTNATFNLEPLENYEVKLYGDGRIVCLELKSLESKKRGKSALWGRYKDEEISMMKYRKYYLYMLKGATEFEIIR